MPHLQRVCSVDKALAVLTGTIVSVAVIGALYVAQKVLIPVALALFFAFLLTPIVMRLQRWGLHRLIAVIAVALLTTAGFLGFGWLVSIQVLGFAGELPNYTVNIKKKVEAVYALGQDTGLARLEEMIQDLGPNGGAPKTTNPKGEQVNPPAADQPPNTIVVEQTEPLWLRWLPTFVGPAAEFLGQVGLIVVLAIFFLLGREDLRNRFIRLVGHGRLTVTTKAVDDATQRLSRFLLMQLVINGVFGICVTLGLSAIGVRYALLWGALGSVLRYVPYIGSLIGALFPLALSIAQFDGWLQPGLVAILIMGLELVTANVFEPLLFGNSIGVSAVALLIAAAFWAFLWGPIGLVLSCPLTVCLVVLGKYVPNLEFLTILLSDEPALDEDFTYYQRLTARDEDEATGIVLEYAKEHPIDEVYDALLIPALVYAGRDYQRQGVDDDDFQFIHETTREILVDVEAERQARNAKTESAVSGQNSPKTPPDKVLILGIPSRNQSDEIALEMLRQMVESEQCKMTIAGNEVLSSELLTMIEEQAPAAVCIAALPPGGLARTRLLCKRLHARFPELRLLVGRWGLPKTEEQNEKDLLDSGASYVRTTLIASRNDVAAWLPALAEKTAEAHAARDSAMTLTDEVPAYAANGSAKGRQFS